MALKMCQIIFGCYRGVKMSRYKLPPSERMNIRVPPEIKRWIEKESSDRGLSLNSFIIEIFSEKKQREQVWRPIPLPYMLNKE